jgi:hypothetical protein
VSGPWAGQEIVPETFRHNAQGLGIDQEATMWI